MAGIRLEHVYKVYPNGTKAVNDFTMDISDKEFIVLVGPSGCGKSTTLRMIAGLEEISAGNIYIDGKFVNRVEPKDRDVAMVFQNYALYPHMTVYNNMAFALKIRKLSKQEIDQKVRSAAEILGITDYLNTKPKDMSGGQRQRVALGRALVREPKVFLLDEPLSNLDAKLRTAMRSEISKLHRKIQTTFIYVTHDQVEAMTMGTRIVVMKDGFIQQIDTPSNLYNYPCNKFVAGFIGTPQMNFYKANLSCEKEGVRVKLPNTDVNILVPHSCFVKAAKRSLSGEKPVVLGIRSEHLSVDPNAYPYKAKCRVSYVENLGIDSQLYADFNTETEESITDSETKVIIKAPANVRFEEGSIIEVSIDFDNVHLFDAETEQTLLPRVPQSVDVDLAVQKGNARLLGNELTLPAAYDLPDGNYTLKLPVEALLSGGALALNVERTEEVDGKTLAHLRSGDEVVFALCEPSFDPNQGFDIDFRKCSILQNDEVVVPAVPSQNNLPFGVRKYGHGKKAVYKLAIGDGEIDCESYVTQKIVESFGRDAFRLSFRMLLAPDNICVSQEGFNAVVTGVSDFGNYKYLRCDVNGTEVYVQTDNLPIVGEQVCLNVVNTANVHVYSPDIDLLIV